MTIKDFCIMYNNAVDVKKNKVFDDNVTVKSYVPFINKVAVAEKLAKTNTLDNDGNVNINSIAQYLFMNMACVQLYTDLIIEDSSFYNEFDLLKQSGIMDEIIKRIPESEWEEFVSMCDMARKDLMQNKLSAASFISEQVKRFGNLFGKLTEGAVTQLTSEIQNMDQSTIDAIKANVGRVLKRVK